MSNSFRCLGTVDTFVRPAGSTSFLTLGTCVTSPVYREGDAYIPIMNDIGGRSVPTQLVRDRRKSVIVGTYNVINWGTYDVLRRLSSPGTGAGTFVERPTDHGAPVLGVSSFDLFYRFNFGPLFSGADTPSGRLYFGCVPDNWQEDASGTRVTELTLSISCYGLVDSVTRIFNKYTEDVSTLLNLQF